MITTTAGETFSVAEHKQLAQLVFKRFGRDYEAAAEAWRRLMQNCTDAAEFRELVEGDIAPSDKLPVQVQQLPDGVCVITLPCEDYAALAKLPLAVEHNGVEYGRSGWNSDRCIAYYRNDVSLATPVRRSA